MNSIKVTKRCFCNQKSQALEAFRFARQLKGFFPVYKEKNVTSSEVVREIYLKLQHELNSAFGKAAFKIGFGGDLSPMAEGILLVATGTSVRAVRIIQRINGFYKVKAKFGIATQSLLNIGTVIDEKPYDHVTKEALYRAIENTFGTKEQLAAPFIHLKNSKHEKFADCQLNELVFARNEKYRKVHLYSAAITNFNPPYFELAVHSCGDFSCISFIEKIAKELGTCAIVTDLLKEQAGPIQIKDCIPSYQWNSEFIKQSIDKHYRAILDYYNSPLQEKAHYIKEEGIMKKNRNEQDEEDTITYEHSSI